MSRSWGALLLGCAVVALVLPGCAGRGDDDPILRLAAEESLAEGKRLLEAEEYGKARPYLLHAFEVEPNSVAGREALLLAADSFYLDGGAENYTRAESRYRDFLNRFPTSDRADYAQFQVANSLAERAERPDRDQTVTRQAVEAYRDLMRLYPESEHVEEARAKLVEMRNRLAAHEWMVGNFYYRFGLHSAAINRFEYLLDHFERYGETDRVLYHLGKSYLVVEKPDEARQAFQRLRREYPESRWIGEIPELPDAPQAESETASESGTVTAEGES